MARKIIEQLVDDIDGTEAAETVVFGLDGVSYEMELSANNAAALRAVLGVYVEHARRTGGRVQRGRGAAPSVVVAGKSGAQVIEERRAYNKGVRAWARANGFKVPDKGRLSLAVLEAFENRDENKKVIMEEKGGDKKPGVVTPFRAAGGKTASTRVTGAKRAPARRSSPKKQDT